MGTGNGDLVLYGDLHIVAGGVLVRLLVGFTVIVSSQLKSVKPAIEANRMLFQLVLAASVPTPGASALAETNASHRRPRPTYR